MTRRVTSLFIISITVVIAVYDVIAWQTWGIDSTISAVFYTWSKHYPIIPFFFGVLMGHLFWQVDYKDKTLI
jgi:hypothetical protein